MRIVIFSGFDPKLNPYILLFKQSLERHNVLVELRKHFGLKWVFENIGRCDCVHLHWVYYRLRVFDKNYENKKKAAFCKKRGIKLFCDLIGLINFTIACVLARLTGIIFVVTIHDLEHFSRYFYGSTFRGRLFDRVAHFFVFLMCHSLHVHNAYAIRSIEKKYKIKDKFTLIPHGNYIDYYPNEVTKSEARQRLNLPENTFTYLFLGLLKPYKGIEDLFDAFGHLQEDDSFLMVAGRVFARGNYERKLVELSRKNTRIRLVCQFIPDDFVQLYMKACDVFVLPYKHITTSGAALLALSFGRPIIAPNITCFPEVITSDTGILYDPYQPNTLASALLKAKQRTWSESQIIDYAHRFDWSELARQFIDLYSRNKKATT